jgi:voltage-gated potassium channel
LPIATASQQFTNLGDTTMPSLQQIVEQTDTKSGRIFDAVVQIAVVISLVAFSIETLPNLSPATVAWLRRVEVLMVALFTLEYLLRCWVSQPLSRYMFSFFGIIDLLAILPFYVASGVDLRSLRAFRLLRLVRLLKLARYSAATQRFHRALLIAKEEIVLFAAVTLILLFIAATGIYHFENQAQPDAFASIFHSLWWAVATRTTVGYGDVYPVTVGGKVFTFIVLVVGLGVVSVPAGLVASALAKAREMESDGELSATDE